jgi:hypothetical protein
MFHRLRTVDLMIAVEVAVRGRPHLSLLKTFLEYRLVKRGTRIFCETTDFIASEETTENRIVPDAAFVLENVETGRRGLFFVEMAWRRSGSSRRLVTISGSRFGIRSSSMTGQHWRSRSLEDEERYIIAR